MAAKAVYRELNNQKYIKHRILGFFRIWELGASRYAKNTPTGCRNSFPYRPSHPQDFPKIDILYIFPKQSPTQNLRSSISPNSRVWGGGTHPVLSAIPWSYRHFSNRSLTRWDEKFIFSISVVQPRQKARNLSATKIGVWVQCFFEKHTFDKKSVYYI